MMTINILQPLRRPLRWLSVRLAPCLCCLLLFAASGSPAPAEEEEGAPRGRTIKNPYFPRTRWKLWREDDTPVEEVPSLTGTEKSAKQVRLTLAPVPLGERLYPVDPPTVQGNMPYVVYRRRPTASDTYAGIWDDVYSSWSGLHGYMRPRWTAPDGSKVTIRDQVMHFVATSGRARWVMPTGCNFVHQSTTGMGHDIANGYNEKRTRSFEMTYFADCLVTSPAHKSYTDGVADHTQDLYMGLMPTFFNSIGSSNTETMAITKMILVGGYLPPKTKLLLKRHGLYPAALLYLWKAALPYDVSYDHELRHRIAYKAMGYGSTYPDHDGAAGIGRGAMAHAYHQYDDAAHMRAMVDRARSMDVAPPEAVFSGIKMVKGEKVYAQHKSVVVLQEEGEDVEFLVSTKGCYDLQDLPLKRRWTLLYGNKQTRVQRHPGDRTIWRVTIPWDPTLPAGRTALALIVNNGRFDSNPAIVSVYRCRKDLQPKSGYAFSPALANGRPVLLNVQDQWVRRGEEIKIPLRAVDPEGFPIVFHKRAGEVGEIDGDLFAWKCPLTVVRGSTHVVTFLLSDETSGNSYGGRQVRLHVEEPPLLARIEASALTGKAPLTVSFSAKESIGPKRRLEFGWGFYTPGWGKKGEGFDATGPAATHTFETPGLHEVKLTVQVGSQKDTQVVGVLVTEEDLPSRPAALAVEGGGVRIAPGDDTPDAFDHTLFGPVGVGAAFVERTYRIVNVGDEPLLLRSEAPVTLTGPQAPQFQVSRLPRTRLEALGSTEFTVRFAPMRGLSDGTAVVEVHTAKSSVSFTVRAGP